MADAVAVDPPDPVATVADPPDPVAAAPVYCYNAVLMTRTLPMGRSRKIDVAAGDRLSSLPDDLLHGIMSFLPVRQAVQTCVLSRRWEHLWCSMPCLNIDQREFDLTVSGPKKADQFEEFVNSLLMFHRASSLDMFRFHVTHTYGFKVVERWIRRGMKCCPTVVELYSSSSAAWVGLPHLGSNACHLKKLHLVAIALDRSFTQLLPSGCPLLEDLKLDGCLLDSPEITSCTLKNLIVKDCTTYFDNVLTITAPDLVSFYLVITVGWNWGGILVNEMPFVANSTICLKHHCRSKSTSWRIPSNLLSSITNVKKLELSGSKPSILHEGSDTFPTFPNLRTLLFDACDLSDDFQTLGHFLKNAPSLEKLGLHYCKLPEGSRKRKRTEHPKTISVKCQETLTFQCPNLKLTEIKYNEDDVHQLFGLLYGISRNLLKTTIVLTKA